VSCDLCRGSGVSGYVIALPGGGWRQVPCRCVVAQRDRELYGHARNKLLMLRYL
jgi:hypothetical protein